MQCLKFSTSVCTESTVPPFLEIRCCNQTFTKKMLDTVFPAYGVHHVKRGEWIAYARVKNQYFHRRTPDGGSVHLITFNIYYHILFLKVLSLPDFYKKVDRGSSYALGRVLTSP